MNNAEEIKKAQDEIAQAKKHLEDATARLTELEKKPSAHSSGWRAEG